MTGEATPAATPAATTTNTTAAAPAAVAATTAAPVATATQPAPAAAQTPAPAAVAVTATATDGKPAGTGEAPKADTAPQGAPEKYEFKAPEGVQYDAALIAPYSEVAKELGLPQDKAQAMLDKMSPVIAARQQAEFTALRQGWFDESQNDPEIGGAKLAENVALAKKAYNIFGTPKMVQILEKTGLGDNVEFIRMFSRAGKAISEDNRFVRGGNGAGPITDAGAESKLYPNQQQRK